METIEDISANISPSLASVIVMTVYISPILNKLMKIGSNCGIYS